MYVITHILNSTISNTLVYSRVCVLLLIKYIFIMDNTTTVVVPLEYTVATSESLLLD